MDKTHGDSVNMLTYYRFILNAKQMRRISNESNRASILKE